MNASDLDESRLVSWLGDHLGHAPSSFALRKFPGGQSNPTYLVTFDDRKLVLRRKPFGDLLPSAHAVDREFRLMSRLHPCGFPVPQPIALCEDTGVIGSIFYVMEHVDGRSLWDGCLPDLCSSDRRQIYETLVITLAQLHAIQPDKAGLSEFGRRGDYFERQIGRWTKQYRAAEDLISQLRSYEGVYNVVNDTRSAAEEIQFDLKPGAEALGLTRADVARQVRQGFFGEDVQRLPRDGEDVRVFVRYPRVDRESVDFLNNIRIRTQDGREVPLRTVADLSFEKGVTQILRRERQRAVIVSAEVATDRINEIRKELDESFFADFDRLHPGVTRGNIGRAQGEAEFQAEIFTLLLIAIGVAYFLVAVAFKSYFEPALILLAAIPFCVTGAIVGHLLMDKSLGLFSYLGIMAAAGVAVNDNLVLIDYVHKLRAKGLSAADALIEAGTRRFRPILLTSLTTFVGLLPLMMERSIQAQWLIPVAIGLAYGVAFALLVTLFFVPALYGIGADIRRFFGYLLSGRRRDAFSAPLEDTSALPSPAE